MKIKYFILFTLLLMPIALSATIQGTVYNKDLAQESNIVISINTTPTQQTLSKTGEFILTAPPGTYELSAKKGNVTTTDILEVNQEGIYTHDIFMLPTLDDEDLVVDTTEPLENIETLTADKSTSTWSYILFGIIILALLIRVIYTRKKYGPLPLFRKKIKQEQQKTTEQIIKEIKAEPSILEKTKDLIKKHDGRMYQTDLRKELNYLSEAKVSLIITELEHIGEIEKIKKGRGNVIILKSKTPPSNP